MKRIPRLILLSLLVCVLLTVGVLAVGSNYTEELIANYVGVRLVVNGTPVTPKDVNGNTVEPFIVDGTTYLPVRAVAEALGKDVGWDNDTKTVYISEKGESSSPAPTPSESPKPTETPAPANAEDADPLVPMPDELAAYLDTPAKNVPKEVAAEVIGRQFCIEVNKYRKANGVEPIAWNDTLFEGTKIIATKRAEEGSAGGINSMMNALQLKEVFIPSGEKILQAEIREDMIEAFGNSTPRQIAQKCLDDLIVSCVGQTILANPNMNSAAMEDFEGHIGAHWYDGQPTKFGAAVYTGKDKWWEHISFAWAAVGPNHRPSRWDSYYDSLGITF